MGADVSRRGFLGGVGAVSAGAALGGLAGAAGRAEAAEALGDGTPQGGEPQDGAPDAAAAGERVGPDDPRYQTLSQGFNQRWTSEPRYIELIRDELSAVAAVDRVLAAGLRPTVRGGGHCYEDFVENTGGAILDLSLMRGVRAGADKYLRPAYVVEGGATNWDVYTTLFREFGRTVPAGSCYSVGAGGHICGGGYGLLSRRHGLTVDHLVQVDMVTVRNGFAQVVRAHRADPPGSDTAELFWAHTGGGGGNFGLILRYYFADTIPEPPAQVWLGSAAFPWDGLTEADFGRLVRNYGAFFAAHSSPGEEVYQGLFTLLKLSHRAAGELAVTCQWDGADPTPLDAFFRTLEEGLSVRSTVPTRSLAGPALPFPEKRRRMPWLQATQTLNGSGPNQRGKYKSAYHRKPFTDAEIAACWRWLTTDVPGADMSQTLLQVDSYGCRVNAVEPSATAVPQRDSILKLQYQTYWTDPAEDDLHLAYLCDFYRDVYAATGGVPEVSDAAHDRGTDGCYVNYPDVDLGLATDPSPAYPRLYYKDGYPRLQQVKRTWDPHNVFHHGQSVQLPAAP
ncbi:FAD-binding oxidoreductase [Kitasatospora camelliae]|uniref:FAD-binding oxidoreductase n=1 Tax=Kitasatospora camelliae TaxID=3156397 RepID=A0AAU8K6W0_9ACTN